MSKDLKNQVLEKIHEKEIVMYPKIYFIAQMAAVVSLALLTFLFLAFSVSFVFFSIHASGKQFLLGFGIQGIFTFLKLFPWAIVVFTALLFFLLEWMIRRFKFSYRLSVVRVFIYTLIVIIFSGILLTFTPIHTALLKRAELNELPLVGKLYEAVHDSQEDAGVLRGYIVSIQNNTLIISNNDMDKDTDDGTWNVVLPAGFNLSGFYLGEKVYIAGSINGTNIKAYGMHAFSTGSE